MSANLRKALSPDLLASCQLNEKKGLPIPMKTSLRKALDECLALKSTVEEKAGHWLAYRSQSGPNRAATDINAGSENDLAIEVRVVYYLT
jgi:hypothetical protein